MQSRSLQIARFPGGTELRQAILVRIDHEESGRCYAAAPALGLWIDGTGFTEEEALADLERTIKLYRASFLDFDSEPASDYLRAMKSNFEKIVA